jgi:hypothetical protein
MDEQSELLTVFRSLDESAHEDADRVCQVLTEAGLAPVVLDDSAPGVVEGTWEVRVPAAEAARAEQLLAAQAGEAALAGDDSEDLDLETVFHSEGAATGEMEATEIQSLLETEGIEAVIVGTPALPNLPFEVRVPRSEVEHAQQVIADAQAAGPAAAEEAASESAGTPPQ